MLKVVCAVIEKKKKVLAVKRKEGEHMAGKWEFPGGKIMDHELPEKSIIREIKEELNIAIEVADLLTTIDFEYTDFFIHLMAFKCLWIRGNIRLTVHDQYQWLPVIELPTLNWSEADAGIVKELLNQRF